jgi:hypothetical protein
VLAGTDGTLCVVPPPVVGELVAGAVVVGVAGTLEVVAAVDRDVRVGGVVRVGVGVRVGAGVRGAVV